MCHRENKYAAAARLPAGGPAWISRGTQPAPLEINAGHMFRSYPWARYGDSADLKNTLARAIESAVSFQPDRRPRQSRYGLELPPLEIVPVNSPVSVKKTGLLKASPNMGVAVSVSVRTPDAPWKRPVPPVI